MNELTSVQLSEWEAYDRLDPIGEWRDDFRMAYLSAIITNIALKVHGEKGSKMTVPLDFMPKWDEDKPEEKTRQTVEQMKQIMLSIAKIQNKRIKIKKRTTPPKKKQ